MRQSMGNWTRANGVKGKGIIVAFILAANGPMAIKCQPVDAKPSAPKRQSNRSPIYSLSSNQQSISSIGAYGIPAYAMIGNKSHRGTYLSLVRMAGLAYRAGLRSEDVLLNINNKVTESPSVCQRLVSEFSGQPVRVVFARKIGNTMIIKEANTTWAVFDSGTAPPSGGSTSVGSVKGPGNSYSVSSLEDYMIQLVNEDRTANGCDRLSKSSTLATMARAYAEDMGKRNFFGHTDPDGKDTAMRAVQFGIGQVAENLAFENAGSDLKDMVRRCQEMMMNEPKNAPNHRGNILDPRHKRVGIGVAIFKTKVITVQEFSHDDVP